MTRKGSLRSKDMGISNFGGLNFHFQIAYNPFSGVSHANIFIYNFPEWLMEQAFTEPLRAECPVRPWLQH